MGQNTYKLTVLLILVVATAGAVTWKVTSRGGLGTTKGVPTLLDFGKGECEACKKMKPILDKLAEEYEGRAVIRIIDIGEHPAAAEEYGIKLIPTQVFIDPDGNEIHRNEGFLPEEAIVAKLREMGAD